MYKASGSTISDKALQLSYTLVVTMAHGFLFYRSCTPISGYKLLGDTFKKYNLIFIEFWINIKEIGGIGGIKEIEVHEPPQEIPKAENAGDPGFCLRP